MSRRRWWVVPVVLAAGCSLPLPSGVVMPSNVATQRQQAELQVLPQGPTAGQSQTAVVAGFIAAQASPAGDYAIARAFLTGAAAETWSPSAGLRVFAPDTERVQLLQSSQQETSVQVQLAAVGDVDAAGHFVRRSRPANDFYGVTKTTDGWRVSSIPAGLGLQLSLADLLRTFALRDVYYLAPQVPGATTRHLVPDRVFLRSRPGADSLTTLVRRVFAAPSSALEGSVDDVLAGVTPVSVNRTHDGVVTIRLSEDANALGAEDLRNLSARLVWTLHAIPSFSGLRLVTDRGVLRPPGAGDVQATTAWAGYDPEGLSAKPPYFFVAGHRLRSSTRLLASPFTQVPPAGVTVDSVAVSPRGGRVATLHRVRGRVEVAFGSLSSAEVSPGVAAAGLSSPTWGSGEAGLWMLQGSDRVVRTDASGQHLQVVATPDRPPGALRSLALSRDGTRAALVAGRGVYVAKVVWSKGVPSLRDATLVLPTRGLARQVTWSTPTELVVLQPDQGATAVVRIAVDGSTSAPALIGSLSPTAIAAAGQALVVAARDNALYSVSQGITKVQATGAAPTFPG